MSTPRTAAFAYARHGFNVLPVGSGVNGKAPLLGLGARDATASPDTIRVWWDRVPDAQVALVANGFIFLDVDAHRGGLETLRGIEDEHGKTVTRRVRTPRGGLHLYFRVPQGVEAPPNSNRGGVEVRSHNEYVLAPPSRSSDGQYVVEVGGPIAVAPAWMYVVGEAAGVARKALRGVDLRGYTEVTEERVRLLLGRQSWQAGEDGDTSARDFRLVRRVKRRGASLPEAAACVVFVRGGDKKARRVDYLESTVLKGWRV